MRLRRRSDEARCRDVARTLQAYPDGQVDEFNGATRRPPPLACRRCALDAEISTRMNIPLSRMERDVSSLPLARLRHFDIRLTEEADPDVGEPPA